MTTTISKHDLQQLQLQKQQQQQHGQHDPQQQQTLNLMKYKMATTAAIIPTTTIIPNTASTTIITTTTLLPNTIQFDSLNNNNYNNDTAAAAASKTTNTTTTATPIIIPITTPTGSNLINNNYNGLANIPVDATYSSAQHKSNKRRSFLNFKSFDFHIKSIYTGLRNGHKPRKTRSSSLVEHNTNGSGSIGIATPKSHISHTVYNRTLPYLKIETVDNEESAELLLDFPQSPYSSRRNSSHDDNRSSSQLLHINRYELTTRSQASSPTPSPYFLSPYATGETTATIRRSSTSDINSGRRSGTTSTSDSRRPSTSDLLRRARERRGSEARMGRSVSHSGLPRGGFRSGCGAGAGRRRTSIAF